MSKRNKKKHKKRRSADRIPPVIIGEDKEGLHALVPAIAPAEVIEDEMTRNFQDKLRKSPLWDEMVKKYGQKKAEELLKQCRAEVKRR